MATLTLYANKSAKVSELSPSTHYSTGSHELLYFSEDKLLVGYEPLNTAYQYKKILDAYFYFYMTPYDHVSGSVHRTGWAEGYFGPNKESWNKDTVTWLTKPAYWTSTLNTTTAKNGADWVYCATGTAYYVSDAIKYGISITAAGASYGETTRTRGGIYTEKDSSRKPYILINLSDDDVTCSFSSLSPSSGFIPKYADNTFAWNYTISGQSYTTVTATNFKFRWRANSNSQYTEVDCGTNKSYTLPANTIVSDTFQWQVVLTDVKGDVVTSAWQTLSTVEVLSTASALSPKNTVINGSVNNVFKWNHIISTSTEQTGADLEYSTDGTTFSTLATVSGSAKETTISAGFFTAGQYYWRVRTYNTDHNAGSWSSAQSFLVIAAPGTPSVTVVSSPLPTINWQSRGQQGYEVSIAGVFNSGVKYGTETTYKFTEYLDDGDYIVRVRIQNEYGLWSDYGSSPLTVTNTAGPDIVLTVTQDDEYSDLASLQWSEHIAYAFFLVYRDGKQIAKVNEFEYYDYLAAGTHTYQVRGIYTGTDNYGLSNEAEVTLDVNELTLIDCLTNERYPLGLTSDVYATVNYSSTNNIVYRHFTASEFPMAEKSKYKDEVVVFTVAFSKAEDIRKFIGLFGRKVCIKDTLGNSVIGYLDNVSRAIGSFYTEFTCEIQRIAED